jgi:hypothetical protein
MLLEGAGPVLTEDDPPRIPGRGGDLEAEHVGRDTTGQRMRAHQLAARFQCSNRLSDPGGHIHHGETTAAIAVGPRALVADTAMTSGRVHWFHVDTKLA